MRHSHDVVVVVSHIRQVTTPTTTTSWTPVVLGRTPARYQPHRWLSVAGCQCVIDAPLNSKGGHEVPEAGLFSREATCGAERQTHPARRLCVPKINCFKIVGYHCTIEAALTSNGGHEVPEAGLS